MLLGLAVLVVLAALQLNTRHARAAARSAAVAAARAEVTNLVNINFATARRDLDRIVAGATGRLAAQFVSERTHLEVLTRDRSVTSGSVLAAGLVDFDSRAHLARVVIAADARVTTGGVAQAVTKHYRWLLTMRLVAGRWLASDAALAGVPQ